MPTVTLTNGADIYYGLPGDVVYALAGNDYVEMSNTAPAGSAFTVYGGDGLDELRGGSGSDYLSGDNGDDILLGNSGDDGLVGGLGSDFVSGGSGSDNLFSHDTTTSDFITEKDINYGGSGRENRFILRSDYLGGTASFNPNTDSSNYQILDWTSGDAAGAGNRVDLKYAPSTYTYNRTANYIGGAAADTTVLYNGNVVAVIADANVSASQFI